MNIKFPVWKKRKGLGWKLKSRVFGDPEGEAVIEDMKGEKGEQRVKTESI